MARSKRTPDVTGRIVEALRLGATYRLAAAAGGIDKATLYRWIARDRAFGDAVKTAEAAGAIAALEAIQRAAEGGTWQAAAWMLERRYPEWYGRRVVAQQLGGPGGGPIPITTYDYGATARALASADAAPLADGDALADGGPEGA